MNILVTGAAGFIGSILVEELIRQKNKVYAFIEQGDINGKERVRAIDSSIEIIDSLSFMLEHASYYPRFDRIFHLATVGVRPGFTNINLICDVNIKMGCQLVDFVKENGARLLVNFGSCFEYGDHNNAMLTEEMDCNPESLYAISKNASTKLVNEYAKIRDVEVITVRPFGVFGKGEGASRLVPSIIRSCLKGEVVKTTLGEQIRDFVNVKDLVKAVIKLSESKYKVYDIYNICSNRPVTVKNFIMEIVKVCNFDASLIKLGGIPYRENEAMNFTGDNKKLQSVINYPFPDNHRDGILDVYNDWEMEK